jgi:hypothetical protein
MLKTRIRYSELNAAQKENFNAAKLAARLADFGYHTIRLSDDWGGADVIAIHVSGTSDIRIQIKGRLTVARKYQGKGLFLAFSDEDAGWIVYPHDVVLRSIEPRIAHTSSWTEQGLYTWPSLPEWAVSLLAEYKLPGD